MEARLQLRQQQRLVMTPMLQQAIQLLQLSTIELQELLQKELTENPVLEEAAPDETPAPEVAGDAPAAAATPEPPPATTPETGTQTEPSELPFDIAEIMFGPRDERSLVQEEEHEDSRFENFITTRKSLADHLADQLHLAPSDPETRLAAEHVIGNLDEDGYLRATLEELAERAGLPAGVVERAIALVQGLEPSGVGARDLRECLLIQLRDQAAPDPLAVEILEEHFEALQRCRYPEIARVLKRDVERVLEAVEEIARLEPKPGRPFGANDAQYLTVDVEVKKVDGEYVVILNDDGIPRLRISAYYRAMMGRGVGEEARRYLDEKRRSAEWLIKSVQQRQKTLYKVTSSIVRFQRGFLDHGTAFLKPLSLKDVAEDIHMHESTVSRVTTKKNVLTPQGLFELKYFFHSGIAKEHGDEVSSLSVKKMIEDLIAREGAGKPLSDQDITQALKAQGLSIARRTVAKYREELGILPSHQRRLSLRRRG